MSLLVSNIQRFSLHDGPGIRTTIFLVGCGLRCPWCANPENMKEYKNINLVTDGKMTYSTMNDIELVNAILKDSPYYDRHGGVTFSGGEPLLYAKTLQGILQQLRQHNINCCIETSLFVEKENLFSIMPYVNEWIIDLKTLNGELYKKILGGDLQIYFANIRELFHRVSSDNIVIRIPLIDGFNTSMTDIMLMKELCDEFLPCNIQFLHAHNLAKHKYDILGLKFYNYAVSNERKDQIEVIVSDIFEGYRRNWEILR